MGNYPTKDATYKDLLTLDRLNSNIRDAMRKGDAIRAANAAQMLAPLGERIVRELNRRRDHAMADEGLA